MHSNGPGRQDKILILNIGQATHLNLGKLPAGRYIYRFSIYNPSQQSGQLIIRPATSSPGATEKIFPFEESLTECTYNFSTTDDFKPVNFISLTETTDGLCLHLPLNPTLVQTTGEQEPFLFGLDEKILSRIREKEMLNSFGDRGNNKSGGKFASQPPSPGNLREMDAYIRARYFRNFLSLEEAEKQLDFVIFNKLFIPDGTKGLAGLKRKIYRKVLRGVYRMVTKNRQRKLYFAKLYGNYVNNGVLADNLQQLQH